MVPRRGGHDKSRIKSNHVTEPRKELWTNRFKTLNTLLDNKEFDQLNLHLKPIFEALNGKKQNAGKTPLDTNFDDKLAKICIKVIDCKQSVGPARHCAVKILAILVKLLSQEPDTRATLKLVYDSLVRKLQPPKDHVASEDYHLIEDDIKLKGLSAYCLNQIDSKLILTPTEAHGLIENSILPLVSWCLTMETKQEKSTYQLFRDNFRYVHEFDDDDDILNKDSSNTYPWLICLLAALTKHSASSSSGGYRKQLDSILDTAIKTGKIEAKHRPELHSMLLEYFDWFKNSKVSDDPITQNINKLVQLIRIRRRNDERVEQLREFMRCLAHLLRLRRHRLELAEEAKLNELSIELLLEVKFWRNPSDPLILFFFANSYQVHTSAWDTIIKLIRFSEQDPPGGSGEIIFENPAITYWILSHFLMIDGDRFYREFASMEVLELIFRYIKRVAEYNIRSGVDIFDNLLREILLTYPDDHRSTKLNPCEYHIIKSKFIKWLIRALTIKTVHRDLANRSEPLVYWRGVKAETRREYVQLCSGLVAVLNRHRGTFDDIAEDPSLEYVQGRWLRGNISDLSFLIMKHKDYPDGVVGGFFPPVGLASVMAAKELYDCRDVSQSSATLLKFIKSSCDEGIQRAPVNSIMSKRYQQIKDSLFGP